MYLKGFCCVAEMVRRDWETLPFVLLTELKRSCNRPFLCYDFSNHSEILRAQGLPPLESHTGRDLVFLAPKQEAQKELDGTLAVIWRLSCHEVWWRPQKKASEESSDHVGTDIVVVREF